MSNQTEITLSKGGTAERKITMSQLQIPDLWGLTQNIRQNSKIEQAGLCADKILECWHLAHDLKNHIESQPD